MDNSLNGRVALVTGGTKGIGKAIADRLSGQGFKVVYDVPRKKDR